MPIMRILQHWGQLLVLAGLLVGQTAWLRADIGRLDARIEARLASIEERLSDLTERVAHIEELLSVGAARPRAKD